MLSQSISPKAVGSASNLRLDAVTLRLVVNPSEIVLQGFTTDCVIAIDALLLRAAGRTAARISLRTVAFLNSRRSYWRLQFKKHW